MKAALTLQSSLKLELSSGRGNCAAIFRRASSLAKRRGEEFTTNERAGTEGTECTCSAGGLFVRGRAVNGRLNAQTQQVLEHTGAQKGKEKGYVGRDWLRDLDNLNLFIGVRLFFENIYTADTGL